MHAFKAIVAICWLSATAKARPGIGHTKIKGIPDLQTFSGISYPKYDLLNLGEYSKGFVPGDEIRESKHETISVPQPYPVKIPVPHPYPVHVAKPYPVVQTKYVKVPHAVPYEIVKHVPVPVEVPKPYPVSAHEHGDSYGAGSAHVYGIQGVAESGEGHGASGPVANYETQEEHEDAASSGLEQNDSPQDHQQWQPLQQAEH